jgi:sialate O-acetylesterase
MIKILSGLANGQVLQRVGSRGATARIAGTSSENGVVFATITQTGRPLKGWKQRVVGKAPRGKFGAVLPGLPVGGPYRLELEIGGERADVPSFFVGDVWVMAGQSNMQGAGDIDGAARSHPLIRSFSMRREWRLATDPLHVMAESPDACHNGGKQCSSGEAEKMRKTGLKGTGVGIFFARELLKRLGVPQGLISTAHGGTSMEQWDPARKKLRGESLYFSMLESVRATGQPVSGLLWYQGESDANEVTAPIYTKRMQKLVAASRRDLGHAKLPWIIVQLARFFNPERSFVFWNSIQEQQRLLPDKIPYFETVPAIDLPLDDSIHIGAKGHVVLGQRMARAADRMVYGNRKEKRPPQLRQIRHFVRETGAAAIHSIEVTFDNVGGGLRSAGEPNGFMLVNGDGSGSTQIYKTTLEGNKVRLYLLSKPEKTRLSYGHGYVPHCNITDGRGFSLPVFGPLSVGSSMFSKFLPYVATWRVSGIISASEPLDQVPCPVLDPVAAPVKEYGLNGFSFGLDGFINEHAEWEGKSGQAYFQAKLNLEEPMKLQFLMGYDGPFKLWLNGETFFTDMEGINPCLPDKAQKVVELDRGAHDVRVGMDLADGKSWGFLLRFRRLDVARGKIRSGKYVKPDYSV